MEVYLKSIGKEEFLFLGEKYILALSQIARLSFEERKDPDGKITEHVWIYTTQSQNHVHCDGEAAIAIRHFFQSKPVEPYPYR